VLRHEKQGIVFYQFTTLGNNGLFSHGVFSRRGGVSRAPWHSLNVGGTVGDDAAAVQANHRRIYNALNLPAAHRATARQVGGHQVACVTAQDAGHIFPATDALVTDVPGVPLVMRFADCLPIVLYDRVQGVAGLVHAGWKGTVHRIVQAAVQTMTQNYGCLPANIRAGIGPGIGPCCYEVGADVIRQVRQELPYPRLLASSRHARLRPTNDENGGAQWSMINGQFSMGERHATRNTQHATQNSKPETRNSKLVVHFHNREHGHAYLDLWEANRVLLAEMDVTQIEVAGLCTACHTDEWFSHRRENGRTGRFAAVVALEQG